MRVVSTVEEDQVARVRAEDRAVLIHRLDIGRGRIVPDDEFAPGPAG